MRVEGWHVQIQRHGHAIVISCVTTRKPRWGQLVIFLSVLVLLVGLLFTSQSSKVTDYDLEIAQADSRISELQAQRDALAVENAKITAAASDTSTNEVASSMVDASSADFVQE